MNKILLIALILSLFSCSSDQDEKYLGHWQSTNTTMHWHPDVIEITKQGESYVYRDAVSTHENPHQAILKKSEGQFVLKSRFIPGFTLGLANNDSTLMIGDKRFEKIQQSSTADAIDKARKKVAKEKEAEKQKLRDLMNSVK